MRMPAEVGPPVRRQSRDCRSALAALLYRNGLIDSRHRDSLASYQIWGLGDERWEDVGAVLGCGDGAGGVSGRAGGGSSCASAGELAAAVGGGGLGGGAGDGDQPALGRQAGGAVERRGAGWAGRSAAQQWRRPGAGCGGSGRSGGALEQEPA